MNEFDFQEEVVKEEKPIDFLKYLLKILRRWPFILLFFIFSTTLGILYNRYANPVYSIKGQFITKKFSENKSVIPGLVDAGYFLGGTQEVYEEIPLLKSNDKIEETINRLNFRVSYFAEGYVKTVEQKSGNGYQVLIDSIYGENCPYGVKIFVNKKTDETFKLNVVGDEVWENFLEERTYNYNEKYRIEDLQFEIKDGNRSASTEQNKYFFIINKRESLVNEYKKRLKISWKQQGSAILNMEMESVIPEKDIQFMNTYYEVVEELGLKEKNQNLENTINFIDEQMAMISDSIIQFQETIDRLQLENRELTLGSQTIFTKLNDLDEQKAEVLLQERYYEYLKSYIKNNKSSEIFAPSLIGLDAPLLNDLVVEYIQQKQQDKLFKNKENYKNPLVNRQDSLRRRLEKNIFEALNSYQEVNSEKLADINSKSNFLTGSMSDLQGELRELSQARRLYELNQNLFDLFLQRKTEAAISKASATSDYQLIEAPSYSKNPVRPNAERNLLVAMALGLLLPIGFFFIKDFTNPRIMDKDDLDRNSDIPLLGNIAHKIVDTDTIVKDKPKSLVAESFRALRANMKYLQGKDKNQAKTFMVTSSVSGEGKTFCSLNLAYTLAASGRKTLLIGADMRKPNLTDFIEAYPDKGLSEYLAGYATREEVVIKGETKNLWFVGAGAVPPNPSELLAGDKMNQFMIEVREEFDAIIIDTSPVGLVADAIELLPHIDHTLLIVRQGVSMKQALSMVNELYNEGKIKPMSVIFNDIQLRKKGYGYYGGYIYGMGYGGYGYGYYDEDKERKKNLFKRS
ncbi:tyrosine-protein kinase domain-containing protein [Marivirga atlantica]|jgi:capsular exopolysaccharide synthesis family protein|uniref:non-specific protein-tyrosine kinase n=1 Tax=Marivirga atlantica TaxID=1548457 RepID=A0A937DFQ9_9BACT|nr:tyrosine-protein kinase family protein [Marivirga atlantica]MBL0766457.1 polysaccharide biosynthesis tyrosine autokinase [Marivirga atlantica]